MRKHLNNAQLHLVMAEWTDEERTYGYRVLEAIMISSTTETEKQIPAQRDLILSEVVSAVIEKIGGTPKKHLRDPSELGPEYVATMYAYLSRELAQHTIGLYPKIRNMIMKIMEPKTIEPDEPIEEQDICELYRLCRGDITWNQNGREVGIIPIGGKRFTFTKRTVDYITIEFLPKLSEQERKDIIDIGRRMRKYIAEDFIAQDLEKP